MPFLSLSLYNFRNLKNDNINLNFKEVFFVGENGQGKSNLLEALYYSAYGSSFRTHSDSQIIKNLQQNFSLISMYSNEKESLQRIKIIYDKKKLIEKNGKKIHDRKELVNTIPCVVFCHGDMEFATGEPECRRFFIDQTLTMYDSVYLDDLRNYKKILKTRNLILKENKYELLDVYDLQLVQRGLEIQKKRKKTVFQINEIFGKLYEEISGIEGVSVKYIPSWKEIDCDYGKRLPSQEELLKFLKENNNFKLKKLKILTGFNGSNYSNLSSQDQDKILGTTFYGPHKDKIIFVKDNKNFIQTASTGQCRLISLLLPVFFGYFNIIPLLFNSFTISSSNFIFSSNVNSSFSFVILFTYLYYFARYFTVF